MIYIIQPTSLFFYFFYIYFGHDFGRVQKISAGFGKFWPISAGFDQNRHRIGWFRPESEPNWLELTWISANLHMSARIQKKKRLIGASEERHRVAASPVRVRHPFCRVGASEHITIPNAHAKLWKIRVIGETFCIIYVSIDSMVGRRNWWIN